MKNISGLLAVASLLAAMGWYCPLIIRRRVNPVPATWIIACLAINIAMVSYHHIPGRTLIENVTLYAAAFEITFVLAVVLVVLWQKGELKVAFDRLQYASLSVMLVTLVYWAFNKEQAGVTFWTTQTLMVVSYVPTCVRAIKRGTAFDSIGNWSLICIGAIFGCVPAIMMQSPYGLGNSARAVISSAITVGILCYFDRKNNWSRWRDELQTLADFYKINRSR